MKIFLFILTGACCCFTALAQTPIRGKVIDAETGNPLYGATLVTDKPTSTTATDTSGNFYFSLQNAPKTVTARFVGYAPLTLKFQKGFTGQLIFRLKSSSNNLDEVIVSTGYQTLPAERATGSFATVNNELLNRRVSTDVLSRLEGVVPGLLFNHNTYNSANGTADISVRGTSTLFASNQPLIVVDGFPYDGDINNINPNNVESITVLKDAAAAAIWGVKSGNGVIVIVTKQGKRNKPLTVDFNANVTIGDKPNLYYSPDFLNSNDFINVEQTLFAKGYYDSMLSTPYQIVSPVVAILAKERNGELSAPEAGNQINALRSNDVRKDLTKYFYRHSVVQQYALDLQGGGLNSDYFISGGIDNNLSNQVGNKGDRVTLGTQYNLYPGKRLTISVGVNYVQTKNSANSPVSGINGGSGYGNIYPYAQLVDKNGNALPVVKDYAAAYTDTAGGGKFYDWKYRPYDELHNADNTSQTIDTRINLGVKYDILTGLSAQVKYEYENQHNTVNNNFSDQTYYSRNLINQFTTIDPYGNVNYQIPQGGILQYASNQLTAQRGRIQLNYNRQFKEKHNLSVIAGTEINQTVNSGIAQTVYGYNQNTLTSQPVDFADYFPTNPTGNYFQLPNTLSLTSFTDRYISYYSNAAYTYDQRYTLSVSGRIDKSNLFGVNTNQKSVPLYSAGLLWNLSRENFYHISWLPVSKFRITYGYNGNIDKNVTALTTFLQQSNAIYTGNPFAVIGSPGNPNLRWERDRIINLGYDFAIKDQVLSGSIEYYVKRGLDLFGDTPLAPSTGFSTYRGNTADIKGNGFDLNLNARLIRNKKFQWQSNFMLSYVLDKVTKYDAQIDASTYLISGSGNTGVIYPLTNQPLYAIYSYKWAGLTHDTGDPQGYLNGKISTDYSAIISGTTTANMDYNGPSRPTTFGSFRNTFSYEKLSLSFNIVYKLNYYFRRSSIVYGSLYNWTGNKDYSSRWQKPGDELHTNVPAIQYPPVNTDRDSFYEFSSALIDKGDHVRLQDITLSYDLITNQGNPHSVFKTFQIYSYVNNVGILWRANHDGLDPDLYSGSLPAPRTISLGVKTSF